MTRKAIVAGYTVAYPKAGAFVLDILATKVIVGKLVMQPDKAPQSVR